MGINNVMLTLPPIIVYLKVWQTIYKVTCAVRLAKARGGPNTNHRVLESNIDVATLIFTLNCKVLSPYIEGKNEC